MMSNTYTHRASALALVALAIGALLMSGCGGEEPLSCGEGTTLKGGRCEAVVVEQVACGAGTTLVNGACAPSEDGCGAGTALVDGACVVVAQACGEGASFDRARARCVPAAEISCGAGTTLNGNTCTAAAEACAPGTMFDGQRCVVGAPSCGPNTQLDVATSTCVIAELIVDMRSLLEPFRGPLALFGVFFF